LGQRLVNQLEQPSHSDLSPC